MAGTRPMLVYPLTRSEAMDLAHALAVRGIVGSVQPHRRSYAVVIHDAHEDPERLLGEATEALGGWLTDRERRSVRLRVGDADRTVRAARPLAVARGHD